MGRVKIILITIVCALSQTCEYTFPLPVQPSPLDSGLADFSKIVILGDGLGSGFMDGALYAEAQGNSIGAILVNQINLTSTMPIEFNQPEINSQAGYNPLASGSEVRGKFFLKFISPVESQLFKDTDPGELPVVYSGPTLNNFSVPFLRTPEVLSPDLSDNPFYNRFATEPGVSLLIDQVIASQPSFANIQLGWQDVLAYAMGGLTGNLDPEPGNLEFIDLTPLDLFESSYQEIISRLLSDTEAEIILTNIPDVSDFPFFNSISTRALIEGQEIGFLTNFYRDYNIQVSKSNVGQDIYRPTIKFFLDDPPHLWFAVVDDPALVDRVQENGSPIPNWRQMVNGEFILWSVPQLPSMKEDSLGTTSPIPKSMFFNKDDPKEIEALVIEYNKIIADIASSSSRLHLFDWFSITKPWAEDGVIFDGVVHTYDFNRTGMFSSDGISMNSRGSAIYTSLLIEFINQRFESNIQSVNPNSFPGNVFINDF